MRKFYAITAGGPYDHYIVAITDDKKKAERIKYLYNCINHCEGPEIEEYDDVMQDNQVFYKIWFNDGCEPSIYIYFKEPGRDKVNNVNEINKGSYMVVVKAEDKLHAVKIASNLVAQYKAQENGIA